MLLTLLAVVLLLALNGFFVAAEFGLVKARHTRLADLASHGSARAQLTVRILRNLEAYLAACQLGITMASLGLGWIGEPAVAALLEPVFGMAGLSETTLHTVSFLVGFVLFSSLHIVVGEQVPKSWAIREPEPVSLWVAFPLHLFYLLIFPLNWLLNRAARAILRAMSISEATHVDVFSGPELRGLIGVSRRAGALHADEGDMLGAVLDLQEVEVGEIMTHRSKITFLDADTPVRELVRFVRASPYTRFPVWRGDPDQIVGILHAKDLLSLVDAAGCLPEGTGIESLLSPPWFIPDTTPLFHQLLLFRQRRTHLALVVDEYGTLMGLVTLEDIVEEIVGDISDEKDIEVSGIEATPDGAALVDGKVAVRDVNRRFDWRLPDEEAVTVAGLVMHVARRIPAEGEEVDVEGYRIEVVKRQRHHLQRLRIVPAPSLSG